MNRQQRRRQARELQKDRRLQRAERMARNEAAVAYRLPEPAPSPYHDPLEDEKGIALLERLDSHARVRGIVRQIAAHSDEWAGLPLPLSDQDLVIEPRFPHAEEIMAIANKAPAEASLPDALPVRSRFWSFTRHSWVMTLNAPGGRVKYGVDQKATHHASQLISTLGVDQKATHHASQLISTLGVDQKATHHASELISTLGVDQKATHHASELISTLGASYAWGLEQESRAVRTLGELVRHHTFKQYLLTGMFLEESKRSHVMYMFRRLRPTLAFSSASGELKLLCALCMHPIGYYDGSWGGAMCPTDDVIAHLMLMRGDEHMFWRRSNQHPPWVPQAGIG